MPSLEALAPGSVFAGRFRIVDVLGKGQMGTAYVVETSPDSTRCALKVMDAVLVKRDALRERFAAEARSTSKVASAHLLHTRDAGIDETTDRPWFTTELLPGEDLSARVSREGPQSLADISALVAGLCDALGKAHALGLIHYDLTPENVHLAPGKPLAVTLRELTVSRLVADACAAEGNLFGTSLWMAPEQFTLGRPLEPASNTWSLALLAFYAATGHVFWMHALDDPSPSKALVHEILREPIAVASERARALGYPGALPGWFDTWFARCMTREPERRFPDARTAYASFAQLMEAYRDERAEAAEEPPRSTKPPSSRPPPRGPRSVPPGELLGLQGAVSHVPPTAAYSATVGPTRARRRGRRVRYFALLLAGAALLAWLSSGRHPRDRLSPPSPATEGPAKSAPTGALPAPTPAPTAPPTSAVVSPAPSTAVAVMISSAGSTLEPVTSRADATSATSPAVAVRTFPAGDAVGEATEYDVAAATKALNRVYYGDCALWSTGRVAVTFAPSGRVKRVALLNGDYDEPTTTCIAARFGAAKMSPFRGPAQSVTADLIATR
jgi:serine/threonine protein kinase